MEVSQAQFMTVMSMETLFLALSALFFGAGFASAIIARIKGYRPWFWLISFGPVGTLLILLKPNIRRATTPEEREKWEQRADWTGGILSGISLLFIFVAPLSLGVLYFSFASGPAIPLIAPPASTASLSTLNGVTIEVVQTNAIMASQSTSTFADGDQRGARSVTTWSDGSGVKLGECVVEISNSKLRVNGKEMGSVVQGDSVVIDGDSVQVNGVVRTEQTE